MKLSFNDFQDQIREDRELAVEVSAGEWVVFPSLFLMPKKQRETVAELTSVLSDNFFDGGSLRDDVDEDELTETIKGVLREACATDNFDELDKLMPEAFLPWIELYVSWMKGIKVGEA